MAKTPSPAGITNITALHTTTAAASATATAAIAAGSGAASAVEAWRKAASQEANMREAAFLGTSSPTTLDEGFGRRDIA